ncbi:MAG: DUF1631 family protein [Thioalkalivibrionaceae bacterium]
MPRLSSNLPPVLIERLWQAFSPGLSQRLSEFLRRLDDELMTASSNAVDFTRANRCLMLAQVMRRSGEHLRTELLQQLEQDFHRFFDGSDRDEDIADPALLELSIVSDADTEKTLALNKIAQSARSTMPTEIDSLDRLLTAHKLARDSENAPWHPRRIAEAFDGRVSHLPVEIEDRLILLHHLDRTLLRTLQPELTEVLGVLQGAGYVVPEDEQAPQKTSRQSRNVRSATLQGDGLLHDSNHAEAVPDPRAWAAGWAGWNASHTEMTPIAAPSRFNSASTAIGTPVGDATHNASHAAHMPLRVSSWATPRQSAGSPLWHESPAVILSTIEQTSDRERFEPFVFDLLTGLFEQMLAHAQLHPMVRGELARMQLPIARIAVRDTGFFRDRNQPARRLVAELVETALRIAPDWSPERCSRSDSWNLIRTTLDDLQAQAPSDGEACQQLLDHLLRQRDLIDEQITQRVKKDVVVKEQHLEVVERALLSVQDRVADPDAPLNEDTRLQLYLAWSELIEAEQRSAALDSNVADDHATPATAEKPTPAKNQGDSINTTTDYGSLTEALTLLDEYLDNLRNDLPLASFAPLLTRLKQHIDERVAAKDLRLRIRQRLASAHLGTQKARENRHALETEIDPNGAPAETESADPTSSDSSLEPPPRPATTPAATAADSRTAIADTVIVTTTENVTTDTNSESETTSPASRTRPTHTHPDSSTTPESSSLSPVPTSAPSLSASFASKTATRNTATSVFANRSSEAFRERARSLHARHSRHLREDLNDQNDDDPSLLREIFDEALDLARGLSPGTWIEFSASRGRPSERMKLVWVGVQTERYVFTTIDGSVRRTYSSQGIAHELRTGRARPLPETPLFDHVLDTRLGLKD